MHKLGKLTNEELDGLILSRIKHTRPEVVIRPHIGEDCAALDPQRPKVRALLRPNYGGGEGSGQDSG